MTTETKTPSRIQLELLSIPQPCPANWDAMNVVDGDPVRFCQDCSKRVYNLSLMTRKAAELFVAQRLGSIDNEAGGSVCVRMCKRSDGTVMNTDDPSMWRRAAVWAVRWGGPMGTAFSFLLAVIGCDQAHPTTPTHGTSIPPITLTGELPTCSATQPFPAQPVTSEPARGRILMGDLRSVQTHTGGATAPSTGAK